MEITESRLSHQGVLFAVHVRWLTGGNLSVRQTDETEAPSRNDYARFGGSDAWRVKTAHFSCRTRPSATPVGSLRW